MPAKKKIEKEMLIAKALEILRKEGFSAINARRLAKELNCSTQPVYYIFGTMEGLKNELKVEASRIHSQFVRKYLDQGEYADYSAYGLGFIRFATEEKELFRFLYLYDEKGGKCVDDVHLELIYDVMQKNYGYDRETVIQFHTNMSYFTYGIAMMMNTGYLILPEEDVAEKLHLEFMALAKIYGVPPAFQRVEDTNGLRES